MNKPTNFERVCAWIGRRLISGWWLTYPSSDLRCKIGVFFIGAAWGCDEYDNWRRWGWL